MDSASKDQKTSFDTAFISDDESNLTLLGDGTKSIATTRKRSSRRGSLMLKALLVLIALACAGSVLYTAAQVHQITTAAVIDYGDCGADGSVEEARAKGCVFDPMSWIWVRPECLDKPMIEDFMNRTDFSWHFDPKLTPESMVPLDVVYRGDHPKLFTQKKYHYVHCTYMWKKMHKALLEKNRPIDSYLVDWKHTTHCEMVLLNDWLHEDTECTPEMVCPTWVRATWTSCKQF